jgi:hypothetical protein
VKVNYPVAGGFAAVNLLEEALDKSLGNPAAPDSARFMSVPILQQRALENLFGTSFRHVIVKWRHDQLLDGITL